MAARKPKPKLASNAPTAISVVVLLIVLVIGGTIVHTANPEAQATFASFTPSESYTIPHTIRGRDTPCGSYIV